LNYRANNGKCECFNDAPCSLVNCLQTVKVGDNAVHAVQSSVLVLVSLHAVILNLLDESINVVDGRT